MYTCEPLREEQISRVKNEGDHLSEDKADGSSIDRNGCNYSRKSSSMMRRPLFFVETAAVNVEKFLGSYVLINKYVIE